MCEYARICHRRFSPSARSLAIHLRRLGWSLVLATIFDFLQQFASTRTLPLTNAHVHHTESQDTPVGVQS